MMSRTPTPAVSLACLLILGASSALAAEPAASAASAAEMKQALAKICDECAIVASVHAETRKGKATGLGAVGGAVLGGVLGHQVGGGTGKTVATVGGAAAGGLIGNEVEKNAKKHTVWVTTVNMKDGSTRRFEADADPGLKAGDVVTVSPKGEVKKKV
jgi:outer membrane lipoprotein SlyB